MLGLRWRLFVNSLRRPSRRAELGLQVFWFLLGGLFVLVTSAGFLFGTIGLLKLERTDLLDLLLWAIFLVWQLAPILFEGYSPGLSFHEVARYPVSFRLYFLLSTAYGVSDPAAATCMIWLLSMWIGIAVEQPAWAFMAAVAFLLFAVFNLLLNRIMVGLFERFQSTRKGRERMVFLMFILILLPQVLQFATGYWTNFRVLKLLPAWVLDALTPMRELSPPGVALRAIALPGNSGLWALSALLLYGCLAFVLLQHRLRAIYQGEIYAEAYTVRRELKVGKGWQLPFVDEVTAAIIEKEFRYIRQSARLLLQLLYPPIIFMLVAFNGASRKLFFARSPEAMLAGMAGFILLSVPNMAYNTFGMDKDGFGRWLLSPLQLRKVLLAKNLANGGILAVLFVLSEAVIIAIAHPRLVQLLLVTVAFFAVLVIQFAAGNLISVYWPQRIELTKMNSRMASNAAGVASLVIMLAISALAGMIAFAAWTFQLPWLPLLASVAILAASLKLYSWLLDRAARYTWEHLEEIAGTLGA